MTCDGSAAVLDCECGRGGVGDMSDQSSAGTQTTRRMTRWTGQELLVLVLVRAAVAKPQAELIGALVDGCLVRIMASRSRTQKPQAAVRLVVIYDYMTEKWQ